MVFFLLLKDISLCLWFSLYLFWLIFAQLLKSICEFWNPVSYYILKYCFNPIHSLSPSFHPSSGTSFKNMKDFFTVSLIAQSHTFFLPICILSLSVLRSRYISDLSFSLLMFCSVTMNLLLNLSIEHFLLVIVFSGSTMCIWIFFFFLWRISIIWCYLPSFLF